jgi:protein-disulfide isomerase
MRIRVSVFLVLLCAALAAIQPGHARAADSLTEAQAAQVQQLVHDYILQHPEVVRQALQAADDPVRAQLDRNRAAVASNHQALFDDDSAPVVGNPKGDVTIVAFLDYRCGYCKKVQMTLQALLRDDPRLRIVHKMMPILGPGSRYAARVALAARGQAGYGRLHEALMAADAHFDSDDVLAIAAASGVDVGRVRAGLAAPGIAAGIDRALEANLALASALGIRGTPAFIIGDEIVFGAVDESVLKAKIMAMRQAADPAPVPTRADVGELGG